MGIKGLKNEGLKKNLELIVPEKGLDEKLKSKKPLKVKLGFDPTAPDLHLGHAVVLKKMREFQDCAHEIIIIVGDATAAIGDPSGKNKTRPPLSEEEIKTNAKTYLDQLGKILDLSKTKVLFNSEWFSKMGFSQMVELLSKVTLSQLLQRDDFKERHQNGIPIHFHEMIYPIVQGYDSVMIDSDIEMGGTDQLFNCLVGRDLQGIFGKEPQVVLCLPILRGTDGHQKMSKSLKNYIGITEEPSDMYGKLMSIPDDLIEEYARLVSDLSEEKIEQIVGDSKAGKINPMEGKKQIAFDIVKQFHGEGAAKGAAEHFYRQVQSRDENLIEYEEIIWGEDLSSNTDSLTLLSLCSQLFPDKSKGDLRRLIQGGGVAIDSQKQENPNHPLEKGKEFKLKVGKRGFYRVKN